MISNEVRVRFAPSPTGYLHVGGLRTALYNYLFARHNGGKFILRIEDTDRKRFVEGAVENLINTLKWSGLEYDEGPAVGGEYGPYVQSERTELYRKYAQELIEKKKAYYCFCTTERLDELKTRQKAMKLQPKYDKHCLNLGPKEVEEKLKAGIPYVIRMNVEPAQRIIFDDRIRGRVEFNSSVLDDQVLIKSDGFPTYHLANVVDDHLMKITHVIRGEEWLSSTPKHILLYDALGWEHPEFAHLPLLLNQDRTKLSKRQGDVAVESYMEKGFFPEALVNFVALLGWTAGDNKEFYYLKDLVEKFTLERVNNSGAIFNLEKLTWLNMEHLRNKPETEILGMLKECIEGSEYRGNNYTDEYLLRVISVMKERVGFVSEYLTQSPYFFEDPKEYDESALKKRWKEDSPKCLEALSAAFERLQNPVHADYETTLRKVAESFQAGAGRFIHPLRIAVSGCGVGPGMFEMLEVLGKETIIRRIKAALETIENL